MLLGLWSAFWSFSAPAPLPSFDGGIDSAAYKKYREYLEKLTGIQKKQSITLEDAKDVVKISNKVRVKLPAIKEVVKQKEYFVDYSLVDSEIEFIKNKLDFLMAKVILIEKKRKDNDEAALVLMLSL